uniref:Myoglobin-like n=1 Tax=Diabrotica virgifera virgifera TaxID=50390 RepID=A0A6P7GYU0_DIAVI
MDYALYELKDEFPLISVFILLHIPNIIYNIKLIEHYIFLLIVFFIYRLFEEHGELLNLFEKFKELKTKEDQANSLELQEHAGTVMNTLDEGIKGLDNLDAFFEYLHQVGASHRRIPGFKVEYFWKIEKPFLEAVELTLGDRYTENVENIYKITIKFIIETLIKGYDNANNANAPT